MTKFRVRRNQDNPKGPCTACNKQRTQPVRVYVAGTLTTLNAPCDHCRPTDRANWNKNRKFEV